MRVFEAAALVAAPLCGSGVSSMMWIERLASENAFCECVSGSEKMYFAEASGHGAVNKRM